MMWFLRYLRPFVSVEGYKINDEHVQLMKLTKIITEQSRVNQREKNDKNK